MTAVPVTPGAYVTLTSVAGAVKYNPFVATNGPEGNAAQMWSHGYPNPGVMAAGAEKGIGDATMPLGALMGVFLDDNAPNTTAAPATRDFSSASSRDQASYDDLRLKQPFFIGDGMTSGSAVQQFRVPAGATRLYLGTMDAYEWMNNSGSFTATINVTQAISVVK